MFISGFLESRLFFIVVEIGFFLKKLVIFLLLLGAVCGDVVFAFGLSSSRLRFR